MPFPKPGFQNIQKTPNSPSAYSYANHGFINLYILPIMDKLIALHDYLIAIGYEKEMANISFGDMVSFNLELQEHIKQTLPDFLPSKGDLGS